VKRALLLLLLASIAIAGGSLEPPPTKAPTWRSGPIHFAKAQKVDAHYCYNNKEAP